MLLALLGKIDRDKFDVFVCALKSGGPLIEEARKIGVRGECSINPIRLALLIKREKPDILHTFLFHANILGRVIGRLCGVPVIISSQRSVDKWRKHWHTLVDRWTSRFCNLIISNSEAGRKILIEREKINPGKIITIYNGIDASEFEIEVNISEKRREFGFSPEDIIIGIIANLRKVKGHRYLFEAVANICSGRVYSANVVAKSRHSAEVGSVRGSAEFALPNVEQSRPHVEQSRPLHKLLVIGDGELKQELINLAEKLGIKDSVIFTGFRNDIPEVLKVIDILALPSLWEGFPVSILEAMASAKPVIASRVGGIPEEIIDEETGLLVPPKNVPALEKAILKLISDQEKSKKMGEAGRKRVEEYFTLDKMIKKTEEVYDKI